MQKWRRIVGQLFLCGRKELNRVGVTTRTLQSDTELELGWSVARLGGDGTGEKLYRLDERVRTQTFSALLTQNRDGLRAVVSGPDTRSFSHGRLPL